MCGFPPLPVPAGSAASLLFLDPRQAVPIHLGAASTNGIPPHHCQAVFPRSYIEPPRPPPYCRPTRPKSTVARHGPGAATNHRVISSRPSSVVLVALSKKNSGRRWLLHPIYIPRRIEVFVNNRPTRAQFSFGSHDSRINHILLEGSDLDEFVPAYLLARPSFVLRPPRLLVVGIAICHGTA
jgi:hypothetical protein